MKDIKALANGVLKLTEELNLISPADARFSDVLAKVVEAQAELDSERTRVEDLNAAKYLLNKHGYAFKIFTPEDVERRVDALQDREDLDEVHVAKIVEHVVNGDDWQTLSEETAEDDANIYAIIEGTRGDHPEWFHAG
jgi:hypothetical protein